jgi:hypothetical protein
MSIYEKTRKELLQALNRIQYDRPKIISKNRKLSCVAVAEEAGKSDSLLHNRYPDVVVKIQEIAGNGKQAQVKTKNILLKTTRAEINALKAHNTEIKKKLQNIASHNARLMVENTELKAIVESSNIVKLEIG